MRPYACLATEPYRRPGTSWRIAFSLGRWCWSISVSPFATSRSTGRPDGIVIQETGDSGRHEDREVVRAHAASGFAGGRGLELHIDESVVSASSGEHPQFLQRPLLFPPRPELASQCATGRMDRRTSTVTRWPPANPVCGLHQSEVLGLGDGSAGGSLFLLLGSRSRRCGSLGGHKWDAVGAQGAGETLATTELFTTGTAFGQTPERAKQSVATRAPVHSALKVRDTRQERPDHVEPMHGTS